MSMESEQARFERLTTDINEILTSACEALMSDPSQVKRFAGLFDRSTETGFYSSEEGPKGEGEQPTWSPNPAYMDSMEELWQPVEARLGEDGLVLEKPLRELFYLSHEYEDQEADHRRVFHGQLMDESRGVAVTYFMLNIPHSHREFRYVIPPQIQISPLL